MMNRLASIFHCKQHLSILFALFAFPLSLSSCKGSENYADTIRLELPAIELSDDIYEYEGFTSCYNHTTLVPNWVAYMLTSEELNGSYSAQSNFSRDPNVNGPQASREDYSRSGWDKGHLCPKADLKWSKKAWWESHYFTNICPQNHTFNSGIWNQLENKVRSWAKRFDTIYVVCGPIFTDCAYGTIGDAMVSIPDAFFKALLIPYNGGYRSIAFILSNSDDRQSIAQSALSVNDLELILNKNLFEGLNDDIEESVEADLDLQFWNIR